MKCNFKGNVLHFTEVLKFIKGKYMFYLKGIRFIKGLEIHQFLRKEATLNNKLGDAMKL